MKKRRKKNWTVAERDYEMFKMDSAMPFFGRPEPEDQVEDLMGILSGCPEFFPALLDLGLKKIQLDLLDEGIENITNGVELLFETGDKKEKEHYFESITSVLMELCYFEPHIKILEIAIAAEPKNGNFRDELAFIYLKKFEFDSFKTNIEEALRLDPGNCVFANTYGLGLMTQGNLDEAENYLQRALCSSQTRETAQENLKDLEWLKKHKDKTYYDYLARPIPDNLFEEAEETGSRQGFQEHSDLATFCVLQHLGREKKYRELLIIKESMYAFFGFCEKISNEPFCLKNFSFFADNIRAIMHKFIFKHGDVDENMMREIFTGLTAYYTAYAEYDKSIKKDVEKFNENSQSLLDEMLIKVEKYNAVRHASNIGSDELETIREELFEGDHDFFFV